MLLATPAFVTSLVGAMHSTSAVEVVAVAFGLVSVYLSAREHIVSWPTAIVNVTLFFVIFWNAKWYADAVLQLFFLSLSIYGWYEWLYGGARHTRLTVSCSTPRQWLASFVVFLVFGAGLGAVLDRYTDSPVPYVDALLTSASLVAQWMMTKKYLENWIVWILADLVYVPVLVFRGMPFAALQYAVFLVLAAIGYLGWKRSLLASTPEGVAA